MTRMRCIDHDKPYCMETDKCREETNGKHEVEKSEELPVVNCNGQQKLF